MIPFPNMSPNLLSISLFGVEFALRWYALAYIFGFLWGWLVIAAVLKRNLLWEPNHPPMNAKRVEDLLTWMILGVIVGGRLGFILFYNLPYYVENPQMIFRVWEGGMSFHGGLLGVAVSGILFFRKHNVPLLSGADLLALAAPMGLFLGRLANFVNAELWGRTTDLPWGVIFPGHFAQSCGEFSGLCARHPSQLYEALLEGLLLGLVLFYLAFRRRSLRFPGTLAGVFFIGYGISRFLVEFVRQPDVQFISEGNPLGLAVHLNGYGFTMGQILSIPMLILGFMLLRRAGQNRSKL